MSDERPLLLLDVDGPLNPYQSRIPPLGYRKARQASRHARVHVRLNPEHGALLCGFAESHGVELAWATLWGPDRANALIGSFIGLPELAGVDFSPDDQTLVDRYGDSWKFGYVEHWARGRPLAWLDDEFKAQHLHVHRDQFLHRRKSAGVPTLLVDVSPRTGLTVAHLDHIGKWLLDL